MASQNNTNPSKSAVNLRSKTKVLLAPHQSCVRDGIRAVGKFVLVGMMSILATGQARAYIGDSFLNIPDERGHWRGEDHRGWMRAEASEWQGVIQPPMSGPGDFLAGDKLWFGGPAAPRPGGEGKIVLSLGKRNPDLPKLMSLCASKARGARSQIRRIREPFAAGSGERPTAGQSAGLLGI